MIADNLQAALRDLAEQEQRLVTELQAVRTARTSLAALVTLSAWRVPAEDQHVPVVAPARQFTVGVMPAQPRIADVLRGVIDTMQGEFTTADAQNALRELGLHVDHTQTRNALAYQRRQRRLTSPTAGRWIRVDPTNPEGPTVSAVEPSALPVPERKEDRDGTALLDDHDHPVWPQNRDDPRGAPVGAGWTS